MQALEHLVVHATDAGRAVTVDAARGVHVDGGLLLLAEVAVDRLLRRWIVIEDADAIETAGASWTGA